MILSYQEKATYTRYDSSCSFTSFTSLPSLIKYGSGNVVTMVQRLVIGIGITMFVCVLAMGVAYNRGYKAAELECEKQTNDLIIRHEIEKKQIIAKIREKSPVERRKELSRYVMY